MIKQIIGKENVEIGMKCFAVRQNDQSETKKIYREEFIITSLPYEKDLLAYKSFFIDVNQRYSDGLVLKNSKSLSDLNVIKNTYNNHKMFSYDFESELDMVCKMTYGEFKNFILTNKGEKKMKEEIQYKIVDVGNDIVKIQITKQTRVRIKEEIPVILIKASNGVILMSDTHPDYYGMYSGNKDELYLRGYNKEKDNDIISMQIPIFEKFKVAIEEYNNQDDKFKKALSNVSEKFDKWNDDMNNAYDDFEEELKKVKNIQEFHKLKFNFLKEISSMLPIDAKYCLDCELDMEGDCDCCEFKKENGDCEDRNSKWHKIYSLNKQIIAAIDEVKF